MMLDTSGIFAFLNVKDSDNQRAVAHYVNATHRFTHNYVAAELVTLATSRKFDRPLVLDYIRDLARSPDLDYVWIDDSTHREAVDLLIRRPDKSYSLCDAVSFILMRRFSITDALTTDHHFSQEGFLRLLA